MAKPALTLASSTEDKGLLTADVIAKVLMLNVSRIHQMGREGIIPRFEGGKYKLIPSIQGYINFIRGEHHDDDLISLSREKAKLTKVQREKAEHELAIMRNQYIAVGEVEAEFASFAKSVIGILETLADRLERDAELLPQQTSMVEATVNNLRLEIYHKLTEPEPEPEPINVPRGTSDESELDLELETMEE